MGNSLVIRSEVEIIKASPELEREIDSHFSEDELTLIGKEVAQIKRKSFLHERVSTGGDILGKILGVEEYSKVVLLSEYIDRMVSKLQLRANK